MWITSFHDAKKENGLSISAERYKERYKERRTAGVSKVFSVVYYQPFLNDEKNNDDDDGDLGTAIFAATAAASVAPDHRQLQTAGFSF